MNNTTTPARPGAVTEAKPVAWAPRDDAEREAVESLREIEALLNDAIGFALQDARGMAGAVVKHEEAWNAAMQRIRRLAAAPRATQAEPGAVEVLNELAASAQEYGNSGSTNSMRRLFAARERADDLLALRAAAPRADATAGEVTEAEDRDRGYGYCPVQIDGVTKDNRAWYFRARGNHFAVTLGPVGDHGDFAAVGGDPILEGTISDGYAAGWMPHDVAKALAEWAVRVYESDAMRAAQPETSGGGA